MACNLAVPPGSPVITPGVPSGPSRFNTSVGAQITIFADSDSGTVHLAAAHLNGVNIPLDANSKAIFTVSAGLNILSMAFVGSDPDEVFPIKEDCGDGSSNTLRTWRLKPVTPGGPATQITINAA